MRVRKAAALFGLRLSAVLALGVSSALLVDYLNPVLTFCGADSGCAAVRRSGFGFVQFSGLAIPVPILGMLAFALLLGLSLTRSVLRVVPWVALLGGLVGIGLFGLQAFKIGQLCSLCVTVDTLGVLAAVFGLLLWRGSGEGSEPFLLRTGTWAALAMLALLAPSLWPRLRPAPPVPAGVAALYEPGKINVVEFADYECPYCRALHPELKAIIDTYPSKVNFKRLNLPLQSHPFAQGAAQAQICAREQGKGDELADKLFSSEDLRPATNRAAAQALGVELGAYDRCIASGHADQVIAAESKILRDAGLQGLPTTYVGAKMIVGAQPEEVFRDAFDRAERGEGDHGIPGAVYWPAVLASIAAVSWVGRVRRATLSHGTR